MGKPLMLHANDDKRIEFLQKKLKIKSKVQVVRDALDLLEKGADKLDRIQRWKRVASLVSKSSRKVLRDFQTNSRILKND